MLPVRKSTAFNLITNLGMVALTVIDIKAGVITALLMFVCECGGNMYKREKKPIDND
ncbi:hypothetical protein [Candidatus Enterococcus ferrettii]|uniref:Uncharacterized protein n=1 Tax=Candidatus Enterococcus ferrettii TaxID=2815324 RepID=A0ABV0EX74_9ENTE|nr:hypothetical protein [Enterococcus sp. 665A]MBO1340348.1 hypothetical protein [Enterococcus sp. 665A]